MGGCAGTLGVRLAAAAFGGLPFLPSLGAFAAGAAICDGGNKGATTSSKVSSASGSRGAPNTASASSSPSNRFKSNPSSESASASASAAVEHTASSPIG